MAGVDIRQGTAAAVENGVFCGGVVVCFVVGLWLFFFGVCGWFCAFGPNSIPRLLHFDDFVIYFEAF